MSENLSVALDQKFGQAKITPPEAGPRCRRLAEWLKTLGLSEYAARFAENRIDFSVLRDITDQDLKDLGVVLGDRRKMLRAISELDAASPAARATSTGPVSQDAAERRQVTVMFSDLVGSTALEIGQE